MADEILRLLKSQTYALIDDINDFVEENDIDDIKFCVEDIDVTIHRIEDLRSTFRDKIGQIKSQMTDEDFTGEFGEKPEGVISQIKHYIFQLKTVRKELRSRGNTSKMGEEVAIEKYFTFLHNEMISQISDLEVEVGKSPVDLSDEELIRKKDCAAEIQKRLDLIWGKLSEMMQLNTKDVQMQAINNRYKTLITYKNKYLTLMANEVTRREIHKKEGFKTSLLNIKLSKFSGYNSPTDIYTFQSEFEKIYLYSTPSELLPDLLKNNPLTDPALSLVKSVEKIEEIWKRLKQAYGSSKILLQKKLGNLNDLESLNRSKDPEKVGFGLAK